MTTSSETLMPSEVAALFGVNVRTVNRWANQGLLVSIRTPGGHHRYPAEPVQALLRANSPTPQSPP